MKNIVILLIIPLLLFSTTYYLSNEGDDGNDGNNPAIPWSGLDTLNARLNDSTIVSEDSICFKKGDRFYGEIDLTGTAPDSLTFSSYGSGSVKPIIDGSELSFDFDTGDIKTYDGMYTNGGTTYYYKDIALSNIISLYIDENEMILAREPDESDNDGARCFYVDSTGTTSSFYDNNTEISLSAEDSIVIRTCSWLWESASITSVSGSLINISPSTEFQIKKGWGYFALNKISYLDEEEEWYYDYQNERLYFCPPDSSCTVYCVNDRNGFDIKNKYVSGTGWYDKENLIIDSLRFEHCFTGINFIATSTDTLDYITIQNCEFTDLIIGIDFYQYKASLLQDSDIDNNYFSDLQSYAITGTGNDVDIKNNIIKNIGLHNFGTTRLIDNKLNNLNAILCTGDGISICDNDTIKNIGFNGIYLLQKGNVTVDNNGIYDTCLVLTDGGGIYMWHNISGNKVIKNNEIKNCVGESKNGVPSAGTHSYGIYLDELSLNCKIDNNDVYDCGVGIRIQNSRKDTITNNTCSGNKLSQFYIRNINGNILNGGNLNNGCDIDWYPNFSSYTDLPASSPYTEDEYYKDEEVIWYAISSTEIKPVYVNPDDFVIEGNSFSSNTADSTFAIHIATWRDVNDSTLIHIADNDSLIIGNISDIINAKVLIESANVNDEINDSLYFVGTVSLDSLTFFKGYDSLKEFRLEIKTGNRNDLGY